MDLEEEDTFLPPQHTNKFGIPNEPELLNEHELYKPSKGTRTLLSERDREIYAEAFIEDPRLLTLSNLCVRILAKRGTRNIALPVQQDLLKLRIHYDSIDVNLPLKHCYFVKDVRYWQRVVLAKSSDKSLRLKKFQEYDWRGKGLSIKFAELVEACPAEFWPEAKMARLAWKIRDSVRSMHIKHLQSLKDYSFEQYIQSESEIDVTSEESDEVIISSDEPDTVEEEAEEEHEDIPEPAKENKTKLKATKRVSITGSVKSAKSSHSVRYQEEQRSTEKSVRRSKEDKHVEKSDYLGFGVDERTMERRRARYARNEQRQLLRDLQLKKKEERELRRRRRSLLRKPPVVEEIFVKKRKLKKKIKGVLDIEVEPEPDDGEDKIPDKRNKEKLLQRIKRYNYPSEHCHHIDLSFVRWFDNLVSFTLEFLGPHMGLDYHNRHLNFSLDDIIRLSKGLRSLDKLKIFRLRNSRMDNMKLHILTRALKNLETIEVIDLGFDQLSDDCGTSLAALFENESSLKALELENNRLGINAMDSLGIALRFYNHHSLEYLGLAHNPLGSEGLSAIFRHIMGTKHVQELNLSGINGDKIAVQRSVTTLLRNHEPLRRLHIAAIPFNPILGKGIIRALVSNHKVIHFDCRECEFESDEEFEADLIVRRNNFELDNTYLGDTTKTEEDIMDYINNMRHPILQRVHEHIMCRDECIKYRPDKTPSEISVKEEEPVEEEYDIWAVLGIKTSLAPPKPEPEPEPEPPTVEESDLDFGPFVYDPNTFDIDQFREFVHNPGPENRFYYLQNNKEP
ncbi:uncharacterized protein LOC115633980 [Scaptodrosophila lebanonensis]|uniref:Uncharacterized protein LOC115633980 n=1 Tax=Drosophila lebanonensis TaxID=7225 RepID=A0A6J2UFY8_DROLE|nr:uncharacterized protein LOC115633980 [Scaptodrosophila lebanonensis]